jgi:hypothetical protein
LRNDTYLLELVLYIHLNPLGAKIVKSLTEADKHQSVSISVKRGEKIAKVGQLYLVED